MLCSLIAVDERVTEGSKTQKIKWHAIITQSSFKFLKRANSIIFFDKAMLEMYGTSFMPCRKGSDLEVTTLAEGGVGGTRSRIPTVARKQAMVAGIAYIISYRKRERDGTIVRWCQN